MNPFGTRPFVDVNLAGKMKWANAAFLDEVIEYKIKAIAEDVVMKSHKEIDSKMAQRTKQFREYIDA